MFGRVSSYVNLPVDEGLLKIAVSQIGPIACGKSKLKNEFQMYTTKWKKKTFNFNCEGIDADHKSFTLYKSGVYFEPNCSSENLNHAGKYKNFEFFVFCFN